MEDAVEVLVVINFSIIGLSHVFQHRAWAKFFVLLAKQGHAGAFANGLLTLGIGSLIVAFYSVWTGVPVLVTLIGWAYIVKSAAIFLVPEWGLRSMRRVQPDNSLHFRVAGILMIVVAAIIGFSLWQRIV